MVTNAEDAGLLQGPDAWGVTTEIALAEQIKLLAEALPRARVVGMLYRSDTPEGKRGIEALRGALPADWRLEAVAVNEHPSIAAAIEALMRKNVDVIWTTADQKVFDGAAVRAAVGGAAKQNPGMGIFTGVRPGRR